MFTATALDKYIKKFLAALEKEGLHVGKAILFGSYASGKPHEYSDIDLAVWLSNYPEKHYTDIPSILRIVTSYNPIRPKFYSDEDTAETDPFIEIIEKTGRKIKLHEYKARI